ncbi:MAG TPA: GNAT family N-acetyltransferase [Gaiellaceae bacterium]|nr:GNAT family N-acetyltransferase [Gaiellaceae bacterium]
MIRPFEPADAGAVAALLHEDDPPEAVTGAGILHWHEATPERAGARSWVAVEGGAVAGWMRAALRWATSAEGVGELWGFVRPSLRRRGLGAALFDAAAVHLEGMGARVLESWSLGEAGGRFLAARGFRPARRRLVYRLDLPAGVSGLEELRAAREAEGYRLVPLAEAADRARELHAVDAAATADVPATYAEDDFRYEDWVREALRHPQLSRAGSFVVLAGERPVAYALLHVDPAARLAANEMTGTHRDHRRRGLARLAKLAAIAWAQEQGLEGILTGNDEENAGIVGLNESLGYRVAAVETEYLRPEATD